jgi:hypothetical protein
MMIFGIGGGGAISMSEREMSEPFSQLQFFKGDL